MAPALGALFRLCSLTIAAIYCSLVHAQQGDANFLAFQSRPDLSPPRLFVTTSNPGVTPGYIFMAPYQIGSNQEAPLIYDTDGDLVWSGYGVVGGGLCHDVKVCHINGSDHLCFFNGEQILGYGRGRMSILDSTLTPVKQLTAKNGLANFDTHETLVTSDGKSALITIYNPERFDLSAYNITTGVGYILNCLFQKIDIATGTVLFEWSAIEHVTLSETYVPPNSVQIAGDGLLPSTAWDFFHINSIDENSDGDFLVSSRHLSTIFKVNGSDGSIIWRLGGKKSDFDFEPGLNFSFQHDARWRETNSSTDIISIFDNASDGVPSASNASAGMILRLDHTTTPPSVSQLSLFPSPPEIGISVSQGSTQLLSPDNWATSNAFINWGSNPYVTEHDPSGTIIFQANLAVGGPMNYRARKFNFTTQPTDNPALYTYAQNSTGSTVFYMSWNGATAVGGWRIYGRNSCDTDWTAITAVSKSGFETIYEAPNYSDYGLVEALDSNGAALRNSTAKGVKTFVPSFAIANSCNQDICAVPTAYVVGQMNLAAMNSTIPGCAAPKVILNSASSTNGSASATATSGHGSSSGTCSGAGRAFHMSKTESFALAMLVVMTAISAI